MGSTTQDANDFLMGGGGRSAKFETIGDKITGTVISAQKSQQTDLTSGQPKTWPDGNPMMQLVVTVQTDERDTDDPTDDGLRKLYLRGAKPQTSRGAVRDAMRSAGVSGLEEGGKLSVAYTGDGEPTQRGFNPPKQYAAKYEPPSGGVNVDDIFG